MNVQQERPATSGKLIFILNFGSTTPWYMCISHCEDTCHIWHPKTITNCYHRCRFDLKPYKNEPFLFLLKQSRSFAILGWVIRVKLCILWSNLGTIYTPVCTGIVDSWSHGYDQQNKCRLKLSWLGGMCFISQWVVCCIFGISK